MGGDGGGMGRTPPSATDTPMGGGMKRVHTMMHMTFFWGDRGDRGVVLFPGWPGDRGAGMYVLCLLFVLALAALTEALSALSRRRGAAVVLTAVHAAKMALAYLVMLAVMSFNVGVLVAAVVGHAVGFLLARRGRLAGAARDGPPAHHESGRSPADDSKP